MNMQIKYVGIASGIVLALLPFTANSEILSHSSFVSPIQIQNMVTMRSAGLNKTYGAVPFILEKLSTPSSSIDEVNTALHSLVLMHYNDLPTVADNLINSTTDINIKNAAIVSKARWKADVGVASISDPITKAHKIIDMFLSELKMDPNSVNLASKVQVEDLEKRGRTNSGIELMVLRNLADMAYSTRNPAFVDYLGKCKFNFDIDQPSLVKLRIATMSNTDRINWLVDDIAKKTVLRGDDFYEIQLASDYDDLACQTISCKLNELDSVRPVSHIPYTALFDVLRAIGNPKTADMVARYKDDKDKWVSYYANQVLPVILSGKRSQYRAGY